MTCVFLIMLTLALYLISPNDDVYLAALLVMSFIINYRRYK